jgi:hypothetical protein
VGKCSWEELTTVNSRCRGKSVKFVECKQPADRWHPKEEHSFRVMEIEYTWTAYAKKFDSEKDYELYCNMKRELRQGYCSMKELNDKYLKIRQQEWVQKAKSFQSMWGQDYVPEDLRCAINTMIGDYDPSARVNWSPLEESTKEIPAEELEETIHIFRSEFTPWNGMHANEHSSVPFGMTGDIMRWLL